MSSIRIFASTREWLDERDRLAALLKAPTLGFVPTMGALHEGHAALIRRARAENDFVLVSIFVNPTQFNDPRDLEVYPRSLETDALLAAEAGADAILAPAAADLYPSGYRYRVTETDESLLLEGEHRPGHFDGMLTVVLKLLGLARATRAYFGEKDYQQLRLVQGLVREFFVPTEIVAVPTVRAADGLALSSRNARLSPAERDRASALALVLREAPTPETAAARLRQLGFDVDYVEDRWGRRLAAARLGGTRLIDNIEKETP